MTPYISGSFDWPPQNIAEKISSGYKAWEFLLYFFGLGSALLYGMLPQPYYSNYCKLVHGTHLMLQEEITSEDLTKADNLFLSFSDEFEEIYIAQ